MLRRLLLLELITLLAGCGGTDSPEYSRRVPAAESAPAAPADPHAVALPPKRIATH